MNHRTPGVQVVSGRFQTAGASAPTVIRGEGFTVSAPSTGVYTVTLDKQYTEHLYADAHLDEATGGSSDVKVTAVDPVAGTITLETQTTIGTAGDLTGPFVMFTAHLVGVLP